MQSASSAWFCPEKDIVPVPCNGSRKTAIIQLCLRGYSKTMQALPGSWSTEAADLTCGSRLRRSVTLASPLKMLALKASETRQTYSRQCLHGDIDAGEDKPYVRFEHAKAALEWACAKLGLPRPIIVPPDVAMHFYWPISEPITDIKIWRAYAEGLLAALQRQGLKLDAQCSVDPVRLLRPPGTLNHKRGMQASVTVESWGAGAVHISAFDAFRIQARRCRSHAADAGPRDPLPLVKFPVVLRRCRQLNHFARVLGNVSEPSWKACVGVLAFVENGRAIAHEWSKGDPRYDQDETDKKFDAHLKLSGPTTCAYFQKENPGLCNSCTWRSPRLKTPLAIGAR
jgi:hypothetical protein